MTSDEKEPRIWARQDRERPPPQRPHARAMRKDPTEAEKKLWRHLRQRLNTSGTHFRRQVQIGPYIVDVVSHRLKLAIEVDGGQHAESKRDLARTRIIEGEGYRVLRFWNNDVLANIDGVLDVIQNAITSTPTPDPSPQGGGEKKA